MNASVSTVCSPIRGRYEVLDVVGRGGQGTVLRALDVVHQRHVALKVKALPRGGDRKTELEEARVLFAVRPHPNLALLREDFVLDDQYYLVMDWIEGQNLRQVLTAEGTPGLPPKRVADYVRQAAEAVDHLHAHNPPVLHQDLKPSNFILTSDSRIVLVDFGISSPTTDIVSVARGTPDYRAPEVFTDGPSPSSDVFSLAATAYALLTGGPPRPGVPPEVAGAASAAMIQAIRRGLAIDPARRPSSAASLVESLQPERPGTGSTSPGGRARARRRRFAMAVLPGLLAIGLLAYGPFHAFRPAARPARAAPQPAATPPLLSVGEGLASCPLGYLCAWQAPEFRGAGVGIFGNERDFHEFPDRLRFIAGRAASFYNNGIPAPRDRRPDVMVFAGSNFLGPEVCLANGGFLPSLPDSLATTSASSVHWVASC